jgi:hypothetical protein
MIKQGSHIVMDKLVTWTSIISNPLALWLTSFWVNVEPMVRVLTVIGTFLITILINWDKITKNIEKIKSQINEWGK